MQHKSFGTMQCPIARSLERVGEWWSILILRDAFQGLTRFDQFQRSLDIAPNMLTRRLNALVASGLLERRRYSARPPRDEYVLTARGRDFRPVLLALLTWGNKHFAPEGASVVVVDTETGQPVDAVLVDRASGAVIAAPRLRGTAMSEGTIFRGITRVTVAPAATIVRLSRRQLVAIALGLLTLVALWYGEHWWTVGRFIETTDDAYVGGDVTPIAPHVAGFVAQVLVADNQYVRQGQPLIRLDARDFQAALDRATAIVSERQADLANLEAKTTLQQATIRQAEADLAAKKAAAVFADEDAIRYRTLARVSAGSVQDSQRALAATQTAQAAVLASAAALDAAKQQLAAADRQTAQLNLGYTEIDAPIDGYIGDRAAQIGAYVTSGTELLSVVPAHGLWVDANFKEDELAHMKPGQAATVVADVLPGRVFRGHVLSLAPATGAVFSVIPPQNATGNFTKIVQRVPVRLALDGADATLDLLRPGLSTTVSVDTKTEPRAP